MSDSNKTVLIADDNQVSLACLEVHLKRMGIACTHAKKWIRGIETYKR